MGEFSVSHKGTPGLSLKSSKGLALDPETPDQASPPFLGLLLLLLLPSLLQGLLLLEDLILLMLDEHLEDRGVLKTLVKHGATPLKHPKSF